MKERCPDAVLIGPARLAEHKLAFTIYSPLRKCGCADIVPETMSEVWGLLYALTDIDLSRMDVFEGCPKHYHRTTITVERKSEQFSCYTYEVANKVDGLFPSPEYLDLILNALRKYNLPISSALLQRWTSR